MDRDETTRRLVEAALTMAASLEWDITDSGYAEVICDYAAAEELAEAADAYKTAHQTADAEWQDKRRRQKANAGLAGLLRR